MRILVTNDDGVAAPGLAVAEAIAADIAGADGEVWVVAPAFEQSGVSHAISFTSPVKVEQLGPRRFAVAGTPADCVILAAHRFMVDTPPDLVLSGVNRGHNVAEDAVYSGTVGGAIEAALQGFRGIALSQFFRRPPVGGGADLFSAARAHGVEAVRAILSVEDWPSDLFYNVNFPPLAAAEVRGRRVCVQGRRTRGSFGCDERVSPGGRLYYWLRSTADNRSAAPNADSALCAEGFVTVTPMRADYTAFDRLEALKVLDQDA